jgi:ABC-2 type transport system ATP-binding protein
LNAWGVENLVVKYGRSAAVAGVTFTVEPGEMVALVGGDGAGKSTVLRSLAGAVAPSGGRVLGPDEHEIGYVPADSGVYRDLTTQENLAFSGRAYGLKKEHLGERIDAVLEATGLGDARHRLAGALSGGMRQKLALGMALVHEPSLLILDEATTGVDPVSRGELWRYIARTAADGAALVFSTTYIEEAERAVRVVALDAGRVLVAGSPQDIVAAVPGRLREVAERPQEGYSYRRGARFRVWDESAPASGSIRPNLQDAVTIAALRARAHRRVA